MIPKAVIFDMDGVIIDSEPIWKEAEITVFKQYGYNFTSSMCEETKGMRIDEVVIYWGKKLNATFNPVEVKTKIIASVILLIKKEGKAMLGLENLLRLLQDKNIKIGLASSSPMNIINAVLDKLAIRAYFNVVHSAEFENYGKPHPQVFITAAKKLLTTPEYCIVIEDSFYGIIAAIAAKMKVIALTNPSEIHLAKFNIADKIAYSYAEIIKMQYFEI